MTTTTAIPLRDLSPHWLGTPQGRGGLGLSFVCPHCVARVVAHRAARLAAAAAAAAAPAGGDEEAPYLPPATTQSVAHEPHHDDPPCVRIAVVFDVALDREPHPPGFDHEHMRPAHPHGAGAPGPARWSHNHWLAFDGLTITPEIDCSAHAHWRGSITDGMAVASPPSSAAPGQP